MLIEKASEMLIKTAVSTWTVHGNNGSTTFTQSQLEVWENPNGGYSLYVYKVHPDGERPVVAGHEANWSFEMVDESTAATKPSQPNTVVPGFDVLDRPPR